MSRLKDDSRQPSRSGHPHSYILRILLAGLSLSRPRHLGKPLWRQGGMFSPPLHTTLALLAMLMYKWLQGIARHLASRDPCHLLMRIAGIGCLTRNNNQPCSMWDTACHEALTTPSAVVVSSIYTGSCAANVVMLLQTDPSWLQSRKMAGSLQRAFTKGSCASGYSRETRCLGGLEARCTSCC